MSLTTPAPDWAKEHIGGPLHLQVAAPPEGRQRGYSHVAYYGSDGRVLTPQEAAQLLEEQELVEVPIGGGAFLATWPQPVELTMRSFDYNLRTVSVRDAQGHLRMWTGYVLEGYWS